MLTPSCLVVLVLVLVLNRADAAKYKWCQCDEWGTIQDLKIRDDHVCKEWDYAGIDCEELRGQLSPLFTNFTFGRCNHGFERNKYGLGPDAVVCCYQDEADNWLGGNNCTKPPTEESGASTLSTAAVLPTALCLIALGTVGGLLL